MTTTAPHTAATGPTVTGPPVAAEVAARLVGLLDHPAAEVTCAVDWAGPLRLPLAEERAVQAACGLMHVHGLGAGRPTPLAVDFASTTAGILAAQGTTAALVARSRGAGTSAVRTSVGQAALFALGQYLAAATADNPAYESQLTPGRPEFVSADGVRIEIEALYAEEWLRFWQYLDAPRAAVRHGWRPFQTRFGTAVCALDPELAATVRAAPLTVLRAAAEHAGAALLPVRDDPAAPEPVPPWTLTALPNAGRTAPAAAPSGELPLAGLRVLESTRRVQGPLAGRVLQLLGARVLRIEPPDGDPMRGIPPMAGGCSARFSALNAGKDVTEIDFTTAAGRDAVRELARDADVFLHNWAPGKAARLGLDAEDLHRVQPGLVHAWASGWGDALGPRPPLGTDYLVQAHSGLAAALRPEDEPPRTSLLTVTDVLGGLLSAQAALAALLTRLRTGHGQRAVSSLYSASALVPRPARRARWGPLDRPLATLDGYLWPDPEARARPEAVARALGSAADPAALAAAAARRTSSELQSLLGELRTTATPVCTDLAALARDPRFAPALDAGAGAHTFVHPPWEFS
ncbi:CoA transferase [Streptomyces cavernicola]|uniref:CoA transferase n=1 Tax=Streptomyces cavernicola TaxID=3043613 RepID=A0ABT6SCR0_9ACTN|nr:CoA transferase [Streptomyces sp. B-S-A6]MDI3405729.1 CoA transferase [Streptomyces sp. B-S-A6]